MEEQEEKGPTLGPEQDRRATSPSTSRRALLDGGIAVHVPDFGRTAARGRSLAVRLARRQTRSNPTARVRSAHSSERDAVCRLFAVSNMSPRPAENPEDWWGLACTTRRLSLLETRTLRARSRAPSTIWRNTLLGFESLSLRQPSLNLGLLPSSVELRLAGQ